MNAADRALAWATGTLLAFAVAAFTVLYVIAPAVRLAVAALNSH
jgi:hypothetical protein